MKSRIDIEANTMTLDDVGHTKVPEPAFRGGFRGDPNHGWPC